MTNLRNDFEFALQHPEEFTSKNGGSKSPMLRYVAALNPEATRKEFVATAVEFGFHKTTATIQFEASRNFDLVNNSDDWASIDSEGRLVATED